MVFLHFAGEQRLPRPRDPAGELKLFYNGKHFSFL